MLHVLPVELSLAVLSYLPLSTLCPLHSVSRKWLNFFSQNQSTIFHNAAILHGYTHPATLLLEDALSTHQGDPWEGATDWKDFCRRCVQLHMNWEGNGRVVARLLRPASDIHRFKVDEKAGILITTHMLGGLSVTHLFSGALLWSLPRYYVYTYAHCEYENGYLVFSRSNSEKEVWRLASDFVDGEPEVAPYAPPDVDQKRVCGFVAPIPTRQRCARHGHFRPWARLSFPTITRAYRLAYPTLVCAGMGHAFLHDVRTGALVQTIDIGPKDIWYVDVNERHVFVCESVALHVFSRADGGEVLKIPHDVSFSKVLGPTTPTNRDPFVSVLPLHPRVYEYLPIFSVFSAVHVSRDGRDLAIMMTKNRVFLILDFERVCRGEASLETSGLDVHLSDQTESFYPESFSLAFEHGRVCIVTSIGLYIIAVDRDLGDSTKLTKIVLVQPFIRFTAAHPREITCMQLTDRRVYFTWDDDKRRRDITLFEDTVSSIVEQFDKPWDLIELEFEEGISIGCMDFSLLPES